jgi:hypothetical protein
VDFSACCCRSRWAIIAPGRTWEVKAAGAALALAAPAKPRRQSGAVVMAKRKSNHDTTAWPESTVKASSDAERDFLGPIMNAIVPLLLFEFSEEHWAEIEKSSSAVAA